MRTPAAIPAQAASVKPTISRDERVQGVMRQNAVHSKPRESRGDRLQRREELNGQKAEMRDRLPQCADHDEWIGVAPDTPERITVADRRSDAEFSMFDDIMHGVHRIM